MAETKTIKKLTKKIGEETFEVQVESAVRDGVGHKIDTYYGKASDVESLKTEKQHKLAEGSAISITAGTDADTVAVKVDDTTIEVNAAGNLQVKEVAAANVSVADAAGKITATTVEGALAELADGITAAGKVDKLKLGDVEVAPDANKVVNIATDGAYNAETNKVATKSTVTSAIEALDVAKVTVGASKTLVSIEEVDGKISTEAVDIAITSAQVTDLATTITTEIEKLDVDAITVGADSTLTQISEADGKIAATATKIQIAESQVTNLTDDLGKKVDKVEGKSLIDDTDITKLAGIEAGAQVNKIETIKVKTGTEAEGEEPATLTITDKTVTVDISSKVDKVSGQRLMTDAEGTKLADIAEGAQVNVIEGVKINGAEASITNKIVDLGNIATDDRVVALEKTVNGYTPEGETEKVKGLTDKVADLQTDKQDKLTAQTAYTTVGDKDTVPVITTNALGQVTSITTVSIDHPTVDQTYDANSTSEKAIAHKAVAGAIEDVREVAAGKTKTFVIKVANQEDSTEATWKTAGPITVSKIVVSKVQTVEGEEKEVTEDVGPDGVKVGDNVFLVDLNIPDRWVSAKTATTIVLSRLETTKVDLTGYVTKASPAVEGNVAVLTADGSIKDAGYALVFTNTTITIDDTTA